MCHIWSVYQILQLGKEYNNKRKSAQYVSWPDLFGRIKQAPWKKYFYKILRL